MWINLQPDQLATLREGLRLASASTMHDEMKALGAFIDQWEKDARSPLHKHFNQVAWDNHHRDGELEVDQQGDETVMVSISEDNGAYVMAWQWVSDDEAGICRECGDFPGSDTYGTVGDGFDGLCASCADKAEPDEDKYPVEDWQYEVTNGDTKLGYTEWVASCKERDADD